MRRYIFLLISGGGLLFATIPNIVQGQFTFAFDMGRDMLWVRNLVELHRPTLIGPWGSIAGVYFGPLWYYLLAIPYLITGGDPRGSVLVVLIGNITTLVAGWWWLDRRGQTVAANIWAILFGFSLLAVNLSSYPFHANLLPLVTLLYLIGLINSAYVGFPPIFHHRPSLARHSFSDGGSFVLNLSGLPLASLMASLSYHLEPAAGAMLTLFLILWIIWAILPIRLIGPIRPIRNHKLLSLSAVLFILPFLPQLLFELRHNFIQSQSLVAYFKGENQSLGGVLPLAERIPERVTKFAGILTHSLFPTESVIFKWVLLLLYVLLIIFTLYRLKKNLNPDRFTFNVLRFTLFFLVFHYLAYTFLFPAELKGWYLSGFLPIYLLSTALIVQNVWRQRGMVAKLSLISLVSLNSLTNLSPWQRLFPRPAAATPDTLTAQLEAVDFVYRDAASRGEPFSVYTYTPPIYDYSAQYLLWWRGRQLGLSPAEYAYLPGESGYLPDKAQFASPKQRPAETKYTYLLIEPDDMNSRQSGWLGHFANYPVLYQMKFPSGISIEMREVATAQ